MEGTVKLVVVYENPHNYQSCKLLHELDQELPLATNIKNICSQLKLKDPKNYALKFQGNEETDGKYVTEDNRFDIKPASFLHLKFSALVEAMQTTDILLTGSAIERANILEKLQGFSSDPGFAKEFILHIKGFSALVNLIADEKVQGESLKNALMSFDNLCYHDIFQWNNIQEAFVMRIIRIAKAKNTANELKISALSILECVINNSEIHWKFVQKNIEIKDAFEMLASSTCQDIRKNIIALINALYMKSRPEEKKYYSKIFLTDYFRSTIYHTIRDLKEVSTEMAHQLSNFQSLAFSHLEERMNTFLRNDENRNTYFKTLCKAAFDDDAESNFKNLMFSNADDPARDFMESPGMLALDCIMHLVSQHTYKEKFEKLMQNNQFNVDGNQFPFGRASIELVKVLCDILQIGECSESRKTYHPMFFTNNNPFEEFFCISIFAFNRTWKDMKAKQDDFDKVIKMVKGQIEHVLKDNISKFNEYQAKINQLDVNIMRKMQRISKNDFENKTPAIVELKKRIQSEVEALIQQHRLKFLAEGTRFNEYKKGVRSNYKFWYARLSKNREFIFYGDCDEKTVPDEDMCKQIPVRDIKQLLTGKDCPHSKEFKAKANMELFSIGYDTNQKQVTLDFVVPDEETFNYWVDGLNILIGQKMKSKSYLEELNLHISLEVKMQLLELDGLEVKIPEYPPPIPEEPSNYDFYHT